MTLTTVLTILVAALTVFLFTAAMVVVFKAGEALGISRYRYLEEKHDESSNKSR